MSITIKFCAANDPALTGITFAPSRAEALMVKMHLERRGYVVDLPTRNVLRRPRTEETVNQEMQGADEHALRKTPWPGGQVPRYRWLRGDSAWLPDASIDGPTGLRQGIVASRVGLKPEGQSFKCSPRDRTD